MAYLKKFSLSSFPRYASVPAYIIIIEASSLKLFRAFKRIVNWKLTSLLNGFRDKSCFTQGAARILGLDRYNVWTQERTNDLLHLWKDLRELLSYGLELMNTMGRCNNSHYWLNSLTNMNVSQSLKVKTRHDEEDYK